MADSSLVIGENLYKRQHVLAILQPSAAIFPLLIFPILVYRFHEQHHCQASASYQRIKTVAGCLTYPMKAPTLKR